MIVTLLAAGGLLVCHSGAILPPFHGAVRIMQRLQLRLPQNPGVTWLDRLATTARHDIARPLHAASLALQGVYQHRSPGSHQGAEPVADTQRSITEAMRHVDAALATFRHLVGSPVAVEPRADVRRACERAVESLGACAEQVEIQLRAQTASVRVSPRAMAGVVIEAVLFVLAHCPCTRLSIRARNSPRQPDETLLIDVAGDGRGPPAEDVRRLLDTAEGSLPRVDRYSSWSLLGLVAMLATIESARGRVTLRALPSVMHLRLELPAIARQATVEPSGAIKQRVSHGTVLLVDDDDVQRNLLSMILETHGLKVHALGSGTELLRALEVVEELPSLVLLDMQLGSSYADEYLAACERRYAPAAAPIVILTGAERDLRFRDGRIPARVPVLLKPISGWNLKQLVACAASGAAIAPTEFL